MIKLIFLYFSLSILILANLKKILNKITEANGDEELITAAMDKLQPIITAANIGELDANIEFDS